MDEGGEKQMKITIFSEDLVEEILSRLPVKSLLRFRCVCKFWYGLIKSPVFISKQLQRTKENSNPLVIIKGCECRGELYGSFYTVDSAFPSQAKKLDFPYELYAKYYSRAVIVGSCNGLVCLGFVAVRGQRYWWDLCLWNPATRERKILPRSAFSCNLVCGFSFDPISNEYKVVRVIRTDVTVYTLGNDWWRRVGAMSYHIHQPTAVATTVNGFPHWKAGPGYTPGGDPKLLICFDSAREVFKEIPQPNYTDKSEKFHTDIAVLGGCLSVFCHFSDGSTAIWVMKDYGLKESWTKQFVVFREPTAFFFGRMKPLGFWSGGDILFELNERSFYLYDKRSKRGKELEIQGLPSSIRSVFHMESLVSLTVPSQKNMNKKRRFQEMSENSSTDLEVRRKRVMVNIENKKVVPRSNFIKTRHEGFHFSLQSVSQPVLSVGTKDILTVLRQKFQSDNPVTQLAATTETAKLLAKEGGLEIKELVAAGIVRFLVEFLDNHEAPRLQSEALLALANLTCGTAVDIESVFWDVVISKFVEFLSSQVDDVRHRAMWALQNIAAESAANRDRVLAKGALTPVLNDLRRPGTSSSQRHAARTLLHLCYGNPPPSFELVKPSLPILKKLSGMVDNFEIAATACRAIICLVDGQKDNIQDVLDAGLCKPVVDLLRVPYAEVLIPALQVLGHISSGDISQTQVLIDNHVLTHLCDLLTGDYQSSVKICTCWIVGNIAAGNLIQIQAVIEAGIIPRLKRLFQNAEFNIMEVAIWAISNATFGQSCEQIQYLVRENCIKLLSDLLACCSDPNTLTLCLEGLENILLIGDASKQKSTDGKSYVQLITDCQGFDTIFQLRHHDNNKIRDKAACIVDRYFLRDGVRVSRNIYSSVGCNFD